MGNLLESDFLSVYQFEGLPPPHKVQVPLSGKATSLSLDLSPSMLHFNPIAVHEHQDAVEIKTQTTCSCRHSG